MATISIPGQITRGPTSPNVTLTRCRAECPAVGCSKTWLGRRRAGCPKDGPNHSLGRRSQPISSPASVRCSANATRGDQLSALNCPSHRMLDSRRLEPLRLRGPLREHTHTVKLRSSSHHHTGRMPASPLTTNSTTPERYLAVGPTSHSANLSNTVALVSQTRTTHLPESNPNPRISQ